MRHPAKMLAAVIAAMVLLLVDAAGVSAAEKPQRPTEPVAVSQGSATVQAAFMLRNRRSGKCLDLLSYSTANNAPVGQWDCHGDRNQLWTYDGPSGLIRNVYSGKCLEVLYFSTANNAQVGQYYCDGAVSQRWSLNLTINIVGSTYTYKCLDILGASLDNYAPAVQYDCGPWASQNWFVSFV